jgi:predicted outer membrane repeat protein
MRLTPATFGVTSTASDSSTGTIRWAVNQANAVGGTNTIDFEGSLWNTPQTITINNSWLPLNNGTTTIQGPGAGLLTLKANFGRLFYIFDYATATISGMTLSNGNITYVSGHADTGSGGAIDNRGVLTVSNCTFSNNQANGSEGYGGAIASVGQLTVTNCTFTGNTAGADGGAIYEYENLNYTTVVTGCTFSSNTSGSWGGAVYNAGLLTVSGSTFSNNSTVTAGGAMFTDLFSTTTVTGSTFTSNSATATVSSSEGGGICNNGTLALATSTLNGNSGGGGGGVCNFGPLTVTDCTLTGNSTTQNSGGAIYTDHPVTVTCSTLSGNTASYGGGIFNNPSAAAAVTLSSSIVAANTAPNGPDIYGPMQSASSYNLIGNGSAMSGISSGSNNNQVGTSSSPINPLLSPLGSYGGSTQTMAVLPGSPALGAGNANAKDPAGNVITTDQRGVTRTVNGRTDTGAFESQGFALSVVSGDGQTATVKTAFGKPLVVLAAPAAAGEPVAGGVVTFTGPASGAGLAPVTTAVTIAANAQASLTATANTIAGSYKVTASAAGATNTVSFSLTNVAGAADHLAFLVQPGHGVAQIPLYPPIQVEVFDAYGNPLIADNSDQVTLAVASGPGGITAGSTATVTVSSGIATFSNIALTVQGSYTLGETGTGSITGANSNSFTIDALTPIALTQNPQINGDLSALAGAQRSMVNDIVYTFNHRVSLAAGAVTIALHPNVTVNGVGGQTVGTVPTVSFSSSDGGVTWVVTFSGNGVIAGSIADGVYDVTLNAADVTDAAGQVLSADRTDTFYRLYGDTQGHQRVNATDYSAFVGAFGSRSGQSAYLACLDYDGNGRINAVDYSAFVGNFGTRYSGFTATI